MSNRALRRSSVEMEIAYSLRPLRAIVAQSEDKSRRKLSGWLFDRGWEVREVGDADQLREALRDSILDQEVADLVVVDADLQGSEESPLAVLSDLAAPLSISIVLISAFPDIEVVSRAKRLGITHVVGKPVDVKKMGRIVTTIARGNRDAP